MDFAEQIKDVVSGHAEEIKAAIDQVGDLVDGQTGGQYAAQVDQAQQFAKDQVDQNAG